MLCFFFCVCVCYCFCFTQSYWSYATFFYLYCTSEDNHSSNMNKNPSSALAFVWWKFNGGFGIFCLLPLNVHWNLTSQTLANLFNYSGAFSLLTQKQILGCVQTPLTFCSCHTHRDALCSYTVVRSLSSNSKLFFQTNYLSLILSLPHFQ